MVEVKRYHLSPTPLIPNSPYPLLHYPSILSQHLTTNKPIAPQIHRLFLQNGWHTQWIFRYGQTQQSHYHSHTHECMAVLSGTAKIRFGAADLTTNLQESTWGSLHEGGVEIEAREGDVFLIPAGVAHKTFDAKPDADFALLTPGEGRGVEGSDVEEALQRIELAGFTMMGAYPRDGEWDFATGGEDAGEYERVWGIGRPLRDPVLGVGEEGLLGLWRERRDMSGFDRGRRQGDQKFGEERDSFGRLVSLES